MGIVKTLVMWVLEFVMGQILGFGRNKLVEFQDERAAEENAKKLKEKMETGTDDEVKNSSEDLLNGRR